MARELRRGESAGDRSGRRSTAADDREEELTRYSRGGSRRRRGVPRGESAGDRSGRRSTIERKSSLDGVAPRYSRGGSRRRRGVPRGESEGDRSGRRSTAADDREEERRSKGQEIVRTVVRQRVAAAPGSSAARTSHRAGRAVAAARCGRGALSRDGRSALPRDAAGRAADARAAVRAAGVGVERARRRAQTRRGRATPLVGLARDARPGDGPRGVRGLGGNQTSRCLRDALGRRCIGADRVAAAGRDADIPRTHEDRTGRAGARTPLARSPPRTPRASASSGSSTIFARSRRAPRPSTA